MVIKGFFLFLCGPFFLFLTACHNQKEYNYHDPNLEYQKKDYDNLTETPKKIIQPKKRKIKKNRHQKQLIIPTAFRQEITLSVSEGVSIKELLLTLAQQIGVDIIIDPSIKEGTSLNANKRPFYQLVDELCRAHGLRYTITNNLMRVERDTPYVQNYNLQFLMMARSNRNRLSIATDVFTTIDSTTRQDEDNGSNTYLTSETKSDFWGELSQSLETILTNFGTLNAVDNGAVKFNIHKQAGIISVNTTKRQQDQIAKYLDLLQESVERQVLIEAKIVEVNLKNQFKSGINWNALKGDFVLQAPLGDVATAGHLNRSLSPARNVFTLGGSSEKITGLLSMLNQFGTVRTLSNPRLTVMNNSPAVLKVARNQVYFKLNQTRDYYHDQGRNERTTYTSDVKTVPIGLMLYVHPTISKNGKIIMTLRPTISQIVRNVKDPAVSLNPNQSFDSFVPEVQVRELDTILAMNSGEIVVVGGLMEERSANEQDGIPTAQDIPGIGGLFKGKSHDRTVTELVIFLRATIIESEYESDIQETAIHQADKTIYTKHVTDPRSFQF